MDYKVWLSESAIDAFQLLTIKRHLMPSKESNKVAVENILNSENISR